MKSSRGITVVEAIVVIVVILLLAALLFPRVGCGPIPARKAQAQNDVTQIAAAVIAFKTEYGHLPGQGSQLVGGDILQALMGSNDTINPKKFAFIDVPPRKKSWSGLSNGIFVDPWGVPYHVAFADGTNAVKAGTNGVEVKKIVAVWNNPAEGEDSPWWKQESSGYKARRYVTSWD